MTSIFSVTQISIVRGNFPSYRVLKARVQVTVNNNSRSASKLARSLLHKFRRFHPFIFAVFRLSEIPFTMGAVLSYDAQMQHDSFYNSMESNLNWKSFLLVAHCLIHHKDWMCDKRQSLTGKLQQLVRISYRALHFPSSGCLPLAPRSLFSQKWIDVGRVIAIRFVSLTTELNILKYFRYLKALRSEKFKPL